MWTPCTNTYLCLLSTGNFTPLIAHITLSVSQFFLLSLSINYDSNQSLFLSLGNPDVRPDPEFGSHPIQLEHINEKSCTIHHVSTEDTVLGISSVTFYLAWLTVLAGICNTVCVHLKRGYLVPRQQSEQHQLMLWIQCVKEENISCMGLYEWLV